MKIAKGIYGGRLGSDLRNKKPRTDKAHAVGENGITFCGVDTFHSRTVGLGFEGDSSEVTCKRCLAKMKKDNV